jgi:hypothetical protein
MSKIDLTQKEADKLVALLKKLVTKTDQTIKIPLHHSVSQNLLHVFSAKIKILN